MKYDDLIVELQEYTACIPDDDYLVSLLFDAADSIRDLQNTLVIIEVKDNENERPI